MLSNNSIHDLLLSLLSLEFQARPDGKVDVMSVVRDDLVFTGDQADFLHQLSTLADLVRSPQLRREAFATAELFQVGVVAYSESLRLSI